MTAPPPSGPPPSGPPPAGPDLDRVLDLVDRGPARLGGGRLLCLDGPAGSGKTTLASAVLARRTGVVVHVDDLVPGWQGSLADVAATLADDVLAPLAAGKPAGYRRWDWHADAWAEHVPVARTPLLVVEGVASGSAQVAAFAAAVVWVEARPEVRRVRGIARDGDAFAPHWDAWARTEAAHFAAEHTRLRADLVVVTG